MVIFETWPERFAGGCRGLQPLRDTRFDHSAIGRYDSEKHFSDRSFNHVRKADEPIWNWGSPKFLRFQ
jgi:hypothetical protein